MLETSHLPRLIVAYFSAFSRAQTSSMNISDHNGFSLTSYEASLKYPGTAEIQMADLGLPFVVPGPKYPQKVMRLDKHMGQGDGGFLT